MKVDHASIGLELQIKLKEYTDHFQLLERQIKMQDELLKKKEADWNDQRQQLDQQIQQLQIAQQQARSNHESVIEQERLAAQEKIKETRDFHQALQNESRIQGELIHQLKIELNLKNQELKQNQSRMEALQSEIDSLGNDLHNAQNDLKSELKKTFQNQNEVEQVRNSNQFKTLELENRNKSLEVLIEEKNQEISNHKNQLDVIQGEFKGFQTRYTQIEKQLILKQAETDRLRSLAQTKITELNQRYQLLEQTSRESIGWHQAELKKLKADQAQKIDQHQNLLKQKDQTIFSMESDLAQLKKEIHDLTLQRELDQSRSKANLEKLIHEFNSVKNSSHQAEEAVRELDSENKFLKKLIKSMKDKMEDLQASVSFHTEVSKVQNDSLKELKNRVENEKAIAAHLKTTIQNDH